MNRQTFFYELRKGLSGIPSSDVEKTIDYYNEIIDDRIEEGLSESEAVATIGPVDQIVPQILADVPLPQLVRERLSRKRKLSGWEIALLILGFPLWFPLLLTAGILCLTFYILLWVPIITLYAVVISFFVSGIASVVFSVISFVTGDRTQGLLWLGSGLLLIGLAIPLLLIANKLTVLVARLLKKALHGLKTRLTRRRNPS
ncbi:MAG: DUF1700 domain-containing protein [Oscillospiraceae bacterium]|nr:DUF1700 domain-containing protein [Oscillospiraceae bacterium]